MSSGTVTPPFKSLRGSPLEIGLEKKVNITYMAGENVNICMYVLKDIPFSTCYSTCYRLAWWLCCYMSWW